jgi:hypothetical protein
VINYQVRYTIQHEKDTRPTTLTDSITVSHEMDEYELACELSLRWACVKGETNQLTDLIILAGRETL